MEKTSIQSEYFHKTRSMQIAYTTDPAPSTRLPNISQKYLQFPQKTKEKVLDGQRDSMKTTRTGCGS